MPGLRFETVAARICFGLVISLLISGCEFRKPYWRTYEEIDVGPEHSHMPPASPVDQTATEPGSDAFRWTTPEGWHEEAGSGMRMATFSVGQNGQTGTCTIIKFGGAAGGLEANVRRWMNQIGMADVSENDMAAFVGRQERFRTEGGFEGVLVDLSELGNQEPQTLTMLAAPIDVSGATLFIKLTGPRSLMKEEKDRFTKLCQSLRAGP